MMEFNVEDGVRLVRSLTDKVLSVMGHIKVQPWSDFGPDTIEETGNISETICGESTNYRIHSLQRNRKDSDTQLTKTYEELKDNVNKLVNNRDKLSAVNILHADATANLNDLYQGQRTSSVCKAERLDTERMDADSRRTIHGRSAIEKIAASFQKEKKGLHLQKCVTTNVDGDNKQLQSSTTLCDRICTVPILKSDTALLTYAEKKSKNHSVDEYVNPESDLIDLEALLTQSRNALSKNESLTDNALKEFERDMEYLTGCNNKTSTPKKYPSSETSSDQSMFVSPSKIKPVNRSKTKVRKSSYRAQSYSPRRPNSCPGTLSVRSHFKRPKSPSVTISTREMPQFDIGTVFSRPGQESPDSSTYSPLERNTLQTNFPSSTSSMFSRVRSGVRRSLFTESSCWRRFLPCGSLQAGKPLGYDAYHQFINVSKTDVLPKYFFENEDEEAVYYLKVKYMDDSDTKL